MHWNVGKVKITKIVELETIGSTRFILPLATNEEIQKLPWLIPHFATDEGRLKMSIHSLVIETPSRRIVVDTGLGNDKEGRKVPTWNNRKDPFLDTLTAAGFAPDSIDTVLCTHPQCLFPSARATLAPSNSSRNRCNRCAKKCAKRSKKGAR